MSLVCKSIPLLALGRPASIEPMDSFSFPPKTMKLSIRILWHPWARGYMHVFRSTNFKVEFASVGLGLLSLGPAYAVDYAKCEAMNNAVVRLQIQLRDELKDYAQARMSLREIDKCGPRPENVWSTGWQQCANTTGAYKDDSERKINEAPIYAKYQKKLQGIAKDYKKEGCP
jgi:hypothetical protein